MYDFETKRVDEIRLRKSINMALMHIVKEYPVDNFVQIYLVGVLDLRQIKSRANMLSSL